MRKNNESGTVFLYGNAGRGLKTKNPSRLRSASIVLQDSITPFFKSNDFELMLGKVIQDDVVSFENNSNWLQNHPKDALIFAGLTHVWEELKGTYNGAFKDLVFGGLPKDDDVLDTLQRIKNWLALIEWKSDN